MAAAKKKSRSIRARRKQSPAALAIGGLLESAREPTSEPALSQDELERARAYVEILRWVVDAFDRHDECVSNLGLRASLVPALQALGSYDLLSEWAAKEGLSPIERELDWGLQLGLVKPFNELERRVREKLRAAEVERDAFSRRVVKCRDEKGEGPVGLFAKLVGLPDRKHALELGAPAIQMELQASRLRRPPGEPLQDRDKWLAWATAEVADLFDNVKDRALLRKAATTIFHARYVAKGRGVGSHLQAPSLSDSLPAIEAALLALLSRARSPDGGKVVFDEHTLGRVNAATRIVSTLVYGTTRSSSTVRDAPAHWASTRQ